MTLKFYDNDTLVIGGGDWELAPFKFSKILRLGGGIEPTWKDIILHGTTALTLVNSKANGLNYLKLFGGTELLPETYINSVTLDGKCEQNGTPTPTSPVDIVCNNGTIKYSINLFNPADNNIVMNYIISDRGNISSSTNNFYTDEFIPVKPNTDYVLVGRKADNTISAYNRICWYDSSKTFINRGTYTVNTATVNTSPSNASYARICCSPYDSVDTITLQQVQEFNWIFQEGDSEPAYQPYVEGGIYIDGTVETATDSLGNTATAQMLLSVGDDKDTQEVISGAVTRNIGIKVFDGTESFSVINNTYRYSLTGLKMNTKMICSHFDGDVSPSVTTSNQPDLTLKNNQSNNNNAYFKYTAKTTVEDFKQWLTDQYNAGTPVIVIFSLVDATTETVTPQLLLKSPVTYSGSITGLTGTVVESSHTIPTPTQPLDINCNNGVVKLSPNLFKVSDITTSTVSDVTVSASSDGTITANGTSSSPSYSQFVFPLSNPISEGTYTVSLYNADTLANSSLVGFAINTTVGSRGVSLTTANSVKTITVGSGETCNNIIIRIAGTANNFKFKIQIEKGDEGTAYHNYGVTYVDGTQETVEVTGKNLFDISTATRYRSSASGSSASVDTFTQSSDSSNAQTYGFAVKPNTTYTISKTNGNRLTIGGFKSVQVPVNNAVTVDYSYSAVADYNSRSFTTDSDCVWILVCFKNNNQTVEDATNVQLELGSTATDYEPYYNGGTATAEMLLKVGEYQDIQSVLDGSVTRKVGIKVLNGSENWAGAGTGSANAYLVAIRKTEIASDMDTSATYDSFLCSHLKMGNNDGTNTLSITSATFGFRLGLNTNIVTDPSTKKETVKAWLKQQYDNGTPVIVVYPLATATTETVTAQPLTTQAGTNIVEITQASMDNLELEVSYKAGVEVTVTEIENAQLDNSVEVTVNG